MYVSQFKEKGRPVSSLGDKVTMYHHLLLLTSICEFFQCWSLYKINCKNLYQHLYDITIDPFQNNSPIFCWFGSFTKSFSLIKHSNKYTCICMYKYRDVSTLVGGGGAWSVLTQPTLRPSTYTCSVPHVRLRMCMCVEWIENSHHWPIMQRESEIVCFGTKLLLHFMYLQSVLVIITTVSALVLQCMC